jgi:hypothetical protein
LSVVFVAIFATLFLGERLMPLNWLGVVIVAIEVGIGMAEEPGGARRHRRRQFVEALWVVTEPRLGRLRRTIDRGKQMVDGSLAPWSMSGKTHRT